MAQYSIINGEPQLSDSFFVFTDVLGFSEQITHHQLFGSANQHLNDFYSKFKTASQWLTRGSVTWDYKIFTDNIVLGLPTDGQFDDENYFGSIITSLINYQLEMVLGGYFVRGGWTKGNLYMDNLTVYGYSLIEAYNLESKKAIYPRIIFSDDVKRRIEKYIAYYSAKMVAPQRLVILKESDGEYFVNYLFGIFDDDESPNLTRLEAHKNVVEKCLSAHEKNPKIYSKYLWCADYHNYFCKSFIENCPPKYLINVMNNSRFSTLPAKG